LVVAVALALGGGFCLRLRFVRGFGLFAVSVSCCMRGCGLFAPGFPTAFASAGLMSVLLFIFFDPCAGRHLLLLLRQKK
jgi:hypothetical protein